MANVRQKLTLLAVILAALVLAVAAASCGGDDDEASGEEPAATTEAETTTPAEQQSDFRVALLFPGTENDGSWANAWADGAKEARDELGIQLTMVGSLDNPDQYTQQGAAFASEGFDLVMMAHGATVEVAQKLGAQFPDVTFGTVFHPASDEDREAAPDNVFFVDIEQHHGRFLAGVLAGLMTKSDHVGAVNGFAFPALTRQPEAFSLGARCVNPDVKFTQRYINSWEDTALAKAAAEAMIANGVDHILSATDQAVQGIFEAARQAQGQVWVYPAYFDSNDQAPNVVLTSVLDNLQGVSKEVITKESKGEIETNQFFDFTFANLRVGDLAPFYEDEEAVGQENLDRLETIKQKIDDGEITIPDETVGDPDVAGGATIGAQGTAPKIDVADIGCTDELRTELGL